MYNICLCRYKLICLSVLILSFQSTLFAHPIDTIETNVEGISILLDKNEITYLEKNCPQKFQCYNVPIAYNTEIKSFLDSCIWQKYHEGEIKEGYARFWYFILFKKGKIDKICFSKPFQMSDESFYLQLTSIIKEAFEKKGESILSDMKIRKRNMSYYSLYRINLYP